MMIGEEKMILARISGRMLQTYQFTGTEESPVQTVLPPVIQFGGIRQQSTGT